MTTRLVKIHSSLGNMLGDLGDVGAIISPVTHITQITQFVYRPKPNDRKLVGVLLSDNTACSLVFNGGTKLVLENAMYSSINLAPNNRIIRLDIDLLGGDGGHSPVNLGPTDGNNSTSGELKNERLMTAAGIITGTVQPIEVNQSKQPHSPTHHPNHPTSMYFIISQNNK